MKLLNIFKKSTKIKTKPNIQKLEKNQLSKVIGGADKTTTPSLHTAAHEAAHVVQQ
ncbi:MAG: hypothetical protein IPL10_03715 [Bacteroidetes bacterium]|jgi:hypothetical protein|nr:hypothetical protein [Bacteroidota bacterium]